MNAYAIVLVAFVAYLALILIGRKAGLWRRIEVTFYGPIMVLRTKRGRELMRRTARPRRFWRAYGTVAIVVTIVGMVALTAFLAWQTTDREAWILGPQGRSVPAFTNVTLMFVYMIFGLGFAVLAHEFVHGVLAVAGDVKVESMGLLLLLLPIGAFVEPNDPQLKSAPRWHRLRLYAAGPATNILLGALFAGVLVLFLAPSAVPVEPQGAVVTLVAHDSPGFVSGISPWSEVTGVGGVRITDATAFETIEFVIPGDLVSVNMTYKGRDIILALPGGVAMTQVFDGPALNAGIKPGMIISRLDGVVIHSLPEFTSTVENASYTHPVNITVMEFKGENTAGIGWFLENERITTINLTSKWVYYYTHYPSLNKEEYRNQSAMGVVAGPLGLEVADPETPIRGVAHPFAGTKGPVSVLRASADYFDQPFLGFSPVASPLADLYEPSGVLAPLPHDIYWLLVNMFYWAFWTNMVLGITNALPAVPMDGGLVLGDILKGVARRSADRLTGFDKAIGRRGVSDRQVDHLMIGVSVLVSLLLMYLLLLRVL